VADPGAALRLRDGPIDLVIRAWGPAQAEALAAARAAMDGLLAGLARELPLLRRELPAPRPAHPVGRAMHDAAAAHAAHRVTPMIAVAGAVADHVLAAMRRAGPLQRAFVNNGGDIAVHLAPGQALRCGLVSDVARPSLDAALTLSAEAPSRGIATSGRACKGQGGRSFSFGIADSVTVLARTAAQADAAASIVANAVDLPGHAAVTRVPARAVDPDSDLGDRRVTWAVGALSAAEVERALDAGRLVADALRRAGLIQAAALALRGRLVGVGARATARAA
jgi:uncharacterized protein